MSLGPFDRMALSRLKVIDVPSHAATPFFFMLDTKDGVRLRTVNSAGKPYRPVAERYSGYTADMLRTCEGYERRQGFDWLGGISPHNTDTIDINLWNDPFLLGKLVKCSNIVDSGLNPVTVADGIVRVTFSIGHHSEGLLVATPYIITGDGENVPLTILTDEYVLARAAIYRIETIGDNFRELGMFLKPFEAVQLESFIALLLTYFSNIDICCEDRHVRIDGEPVKAVPTVIIEKFEADRSLYLRVPELADGGDALSYPLYVVDAGPDNENIIARHVVGPEERTDDKSFLKFLRGFAPDKDSRDNIFAENGLFIIPEETASRFLLEGLPELLGRYNITGLDKLKEYKIRPVTPRLNLKFSSGIDFLEGSADVDIDGRLLSLAELMEQYHRQRYILLDDGTRAVIDSNFVSRIERIFKPDKRGKVKISFFDLPEIEQLLDNTSSDSPALKRPREFYRGFASLPSQQLAAPAVNATLRNYQREGVKWLRYLYDNGMGGCLADDMGLGKTLQVITLLTLIYPGQTEPSLIVMPRSLLFNWADEISRFAPQLSVYTYYGTNRSLDEAMKHQVILTTYAMVRNDIDKMSSLHFQMIVLDESQTVKNYAAQQTRSILLLKADKRFALSGTPVENNLSELYSLFKFLNPAMFGSYDDFNRNYVQPTLRNDNREALASLRRKIFPFMLRRLKKDVLTDLPDRIDQTLYVEMDTGHARFYEERRKYYRARVKESIADEGINKSRFVMFQALSELRRIASIPDSLTDGRIPSPKIELLSERIESAVRNGHKVVVFFNFIAGLETLAQRLEEAGITCATMTGATHNRSAVVNTFQNSPDCKVLVMTLKTGGVGLNLTAADTVFIAEPWWNKAAEEQAINRLHRIGQKSAVFCFSTIVRGTIEEKIRELQQMKSDLFDNVIGNDEDSSKMLTEEDINFILS